MSERDEDHWLWRLDAHDWLAAANRELEQGRGQLGRRRTAVTHARRAAGMALNGVLVAMVARGWSRERCETAWGRSYIDHLRSLATAPENGDPGGDRAALEPFDAEQAERCRALLDISVMPQTQTGLIRLSVRRDEAAARSLELAAAIVRACASVLGS